MNKTIFLSLFFILGLLNSAIFSQEVNWVYLESGETNDTSCTSTSDPNESMACFGLEYTPGVTGTMTSYTVGYIVDCNEGAVSIDSAFSCVMVDATDIFSDCAGFGASLLQTSANSGSVPVEMNIPVIVHQVCVFLDLNDTILVVADEVTGATFSIDLPGGGAVTDSPVVPTEIMLTDSVYNLISCVDTTVCSLGFDTTSNLILFPTNINGNILDGSSDTTTMAIYGIDVYDEENEICGRSGGIEDVEITMHILSTEDQYGNGKIDSLAGDTHRIYQDSAGLVIDIPFGSNSENETSSGDLRGFSMKVLFADHIEIIANNLSVNVSGINEASSAYESAALVFLDVDGVPFDTLSYNGFFMSGADLTGNCLAGTMNTSPWTTMGDGTGTFVVADVANVDLNDPCNSAPGSTTLDTLMIHARLDAGLDSATVVQGFKLIVYGEDVAAPGTLDDGSGAGTDDGVAGNTPTSTSLVLSSKILGFSVDGCVFKQEILPVEMLSFEAFKNKNTVLLNWKTSNEVNHSHFEVEWSSDGRSFSNIGNVFDGDNEETYNAYNHMHFQPVLGYNYYRIKQVDLDGRFEYSLIRSVMYASDQNAVVIYPNPVGNELTIDFTKRLDYDVQVQILNIHGQKVYSQSLKSGLSFHRLSTENLPLGQYILLVDNKPHRFIKN